MMTHSGIPLTRVQGRTVALFGCGWSLTHAHVPGEIKADRAEYNVAHANGQRVLTVSDPDSHSRRALVSCDSSADGAEKRAFLI